jgi:hypothetical protein
VNPHCPSGELKVRVDAIRRERARSMAGEVAPPRQPSKAKVVRFHRLGDDY